MVEVNNVSMMFNFYKEKIDSLKEYFVRLMKGNLHYEEFWALRDISFKMEKGESMGIIGRNGSGKSTLLKLIAGVMKPSAGNVAVYGSVAPIIELGTGFDPELTARENIYLNGAVLGYSRVGINNKYDEIVAFSELEDFMEIPLKNFSTGMYGRLGFAIATINKPDILIVDEVLSVGDFKFQIKCEEKIQELLRDGTTLLFVSHNAGQVMNLCKRAVWIEHGHMMAAGGSEDVCRQYAAS